MIHLQFKGSEEIILNNPIELNQYLSSGTIKGIMTFSLASEVLKAGEYLVVDEYDRNDSIYITRNRHGITIDNLSNILKRNDIKKSIASAIHKEAVNGISPI